MKKIKTLIILCSIMLIVFFQFALKIEENNNNKKLLNNKKQMTQVLSFIKRDLGNQLNGDTKLINVKKLKSKIKNRKLLKDINKYGFNGCFKIGKGKLKYFDVRCDRYIIDNTISSNPEIIEDLIPVRKENNKYVKTNYINWYNYDKLKFAYAITSEYKFKENEIIDNEKIENVFVWIPAFYYNERSEVISYKPLGDTRNHCQYTTHNYLPFAFFFKNDNIHGFWLQLDSSEVKKIRVRDNIDIHNITNDELFAINLFQKYYNVEYYFSNIENSIVISVGRGAFFNEKN